MDSCSEDVSSGEVNEHDVLVGLAALPVEVSEKRPTCDRCNRPTRVCLCPFLPKERVKISTTLYIIQHPHEEVRVLRTAPILDMCLQKDRVHIIKGRRFARNQLVDRVTSNPNTLLLFPCPDAVDIETIPTDNGQSYNLILIDGTWPQARSIFSNNRIFKKPRPVKLSLDVVSEYVIRTQPTDAALSTVEAAAVALVALEKKPELKEILARPLRALCDFQLQHGAVPHVSKEYQKKNGLYKKQTRQEDER
ncbi:tRNA-uridine aminocarboxypropyltransferase 2-like [Saccoglossus kowalevskii]|uniref:tRNA-uridine aminocarboxypropyltransferase n=1 Tax=Saccoglossus kowalevskii TaxID=10224 RepID=A0ABM0GIW8_SACKO|nr:PREDICTED: DTW domain-containing protein 2-like [Saccoglossus kowalevskii]